MSRGVGPCVALPLLAALWAIPGDGAAAAAAGCRPCVVQAGVRCVPYDGILVFDSAEPDVAPAYWTVFAERDAGRRGQVRGRVAVWADYSYPRPNVPGLPADCAEDDQTQCAGAEAQLAGRVTRRRFRGTATYADGATCEFRVALAFGLGGARPNAYVCRGPGGEVLGRGPLRMQGIRLRGCRP